MGVVARVGQVIDRKGREYNESFSGWHLYRPCAPQWCVRLKNSLMAAQQLNHAHRWCIFSGTMPYDGARLAGADARRRLSI